MSNELQPVFRPRAIAVVGASKKAGTFGHRIILNLLNFGFEGTIFPVNPSVNFIHSLKCYPSVRDIPAAVDLAVILVPPDQVLKVADECGAIGASALVIISDGFRESGPAGRQIEQELLDIIRHYGMRLLGPNCMGVINTEGNVRLNATISAAGVHTGTVGCICQNSASGEAVFQLADRLNLGFSLFAGMGNRTDISGNDLLAAFAADPDTDIILLYVENFGNPRRFYRIARETTRRKPMIVVSANEIRADQFSTSIHTSVLAKSEVATNAFLNQCGVLRVSTVDTMFKLALTFAHQPIPAGDRVAVITNAPGPENLATAALLSRGLSLAGLTEETTAALDRIAPRKRPTGNPLHIERSASEETFRRAAEALLANEHTDALLMIYVTARQSDGLAVMRRLTDLDQQYPQKTIIGCLMGYEGILSGEKFPETARIPVYRFPESAAQALAAMRKYRAFREKIVGQQRTFPVDRETVQNIIDVARRENRNELSHTETFRILAAYGFQMPATHIVRDVDEAIDFAGRLDGPTVLKLASRSIDNKSDVGGVQLDLRTPGDIRSAHREILKTVRKRFPWASINGFIVQEMINGGQESVLGMMCHPQWGPVIMFGLGGKYVEVLRDVSFRIAPLTDADALEMINSLRSSPLLKGVRGEKPVNIGHLIESLQRLSQLTIDFDEIQELDINPYIISERAENCKIVDARIVLKNRPKP